MKNRAGWLALLVLAIATLLMVFVIIPRISEPEKAAEAPSAPATQQPAATPPAPVDVAGEALEKMGRLGKAADEAVAGLAGLFADNKVPSADAFAAARTAAETAVSALATIEVPDALEAAAKESLNTARGHAEKALALIKALPADPREAVAAIGAIAGALKGEPAPQSAATTPVAPTNDATADTAASDAPRFDLLRVEPDGSTVIAGNAVPGSKIDILNGDTVIASAEVGPSGDFAAVLDTPLQPGDHALALRATDPSGKTVTSEEVASVSVPATDDGKLLALISKPGEASRIITLPEAVNEADKQSRLASAEAPATPDLPAASLDLTSTPPIGAEPAGTQPAAQPSTTPSSATVQVTAVEIEGDKIFIAGTASTAGSVRAFADDQPVGTAVIDGAGHFVVEGRLALAVGDHTVSVELLDGNGQVAVRASVPFNRPEGTQVAVVAPSADSASGTMVPLDRGAFDKQVDTLAKAYDILGAQFADGKEPALEAVAAARSATEIALKSLSEFRLASDAPAVMTEAVGKTALAAREALTLMEGLANTVEAVRDNLPKIAGLIDAVLKAAPPATPDTAAPVAQETSPAASQSASAGTDGAPTINQAPLQKSENSVIIRQGDTLWQISRRVYGQGVRYTTIYLANEDQIVNPDLIEPGQIFKVPGEALPNAEEIHRKRLSGQRID